MNCEIDATACSASLTEDSSGMEMDHMLTVSMVPDALALEKGIGWSLALDQSITTGLG